MSLKKEETSASEAADKTRTSKTDRTKKNLNISVPILIKNGTKTMSKTSEDFKKKDSKFNSKKVDRENSPPGIAKLVFSIYPIWPTLREPPIRHSKKNMEFFFSTPSGPLLITTPPRLSSWRMPPPRHSLPPPRLSSWRVSPVPPPPPR